MLDHQDKTQLIVFMETSKHKKGHNGHDEQLPSSEIQETRGNVATCNNNPFEAKNIDKESFIQDDGCFRNEIQAFFVSISFDASSSSHCHQTKIECTRG
ncbi:hypothetical protein B9Z55_025496 [Caenorhabditis nigoni]|uniref:Uncharacterized protein n=1 Tax=Caenorhabditis nigoni TaxID=1611254 RepID=A0A2G5SYV8_9PELO|nr:hypothetical protein B9Z55_025496 [Caenorhabditis nigoni]